MAKEIPNARWLVASIRVRGTVSPEDGSAPVPRSEFYGSHEQPSVSKANPHRYKLVAMEIQPHCGLKIGHRDEGVAIPVTGGS